MRPGIDESLDAWHLGRDYGSLPKLNSDFISTPAPIERVLSIPSARHFIGVVYFNIESWRPMSAYSTPLSGMRL